MANTSQTYSTETSIQNDFKIFLGKKTEIADILKAGKVVDRKWYLAWDTGEIFIGNKLHKLMKFGGTNEDLDKDDVRDLISEVTTNKFNEIRRQMTNALQQYESVNTRLITFQAEYSASMRSLNADILNTVSQKVSEVLSDISNITYSKSDIDLKFNQTLQNIRTYLSENYVSKTELADYATKEYVIDEMKDALIHTSGETIKSNVSLRKSGLYFCTSNSDDGVYSRAHIYYLMNGFVEDMTPAGSGGGGGGVYVAPTVKLHYTGSDGTQAKTESYVIRLGTSFSESRVFEWSVDAPDQVSGKLSFMAPLNNRPDNQYRTLTQISPTSRIKTISLTNNSYDASSIYDSGLIYPEAGIYKYILSGIDKQGTALSGVFTLNVVAPIYYGEGLNEVSRIYPQEQFAYAVKLSPGGEYVFTIRTPGRYAWFCIPSSMSVSKFTMNGFTAPFEEEDRKLLTFGSTLSQEYRCFRSVEPLQAGHYTINIQ